MTRRRKPSPDRLVVIAGCIQSRAPGTIGFRGPMFRCRVRSVILRVGLTGGIGCGKSTVLRMLRERGAAVISADDIVHELLRSDTHVRSRIRASFGDDVFDSEGSIVPSRLAAIVFSSPERRHELEAILHPGVRRRIAAWMEECRKAGWTVGVAEVPLLFEAAYQDDFDATVAVTAEHEVCLCRLTGRGFPRAEAEARVAAQLSTEEKAARADFVVSNNGSLDALGAEAGRLWSVLIGLRERLSG